MPSTSVATKKPTSLPTPTLPPPPTLADDGTPDDLDTFVATHPATTATSGAAAGAPDDLDSFVAGHPAVAATQATQVHPPAQSHAIPPPPDPLWRQYLDAAFIDPAIGVAKGVGSTALGIGQLAEKGRRALSLAPDYQAVPDATFDSARASIEPHGFMQHVGMLGEQVGEAFLPAGEVNKVIEGTAGMSKLARVGIAAGAEGLAGAGVGAAQSGGDPLATVLGAAGGALFRGVSTARAIAKESALAANQALIDSAAKFGVDLQQVEQVHSTWNRILNTIARKTPTGAPTMQEFDLARNRQVADAAATKLLDLTSAMPPREAGEFIQQNLQMVRQTEQRAFGDALDQIGEQAKSSRVYVSMRGNAMRRADELMNEATKSRSASPELAAKTEKYVAILHDFGRGRDLGQLPKRVNFDTAAATLKDLNEIIYSSEELTPHRAQLLQLKKAFEQDVTQGFADAGRTDLAQSFRATRDRLASTYRLFEEPVIASIMKNGTPETIVNSLMGSGAETKATLLRKALHTQNMNEVRAAVWQRMIGEQGAMSPEGVFQGRKLADTWGKLGDGAKQAIFGDPAPVKNIDEFVKLADATSITRSTGKSLLPTLGMGAQMLGAGYGAEKAVKALWRDDKGDFWLNVGIGTASLVTPALLAKYLTSPGAVKVATRALTTDATTTAGRTLIAKLAEELGIQGANKKNATVRAEIGAGGTQGGSNMTNAEWMAAHRDLYPLKQNNP